MLSGAGRQAGGGPMKIPDEIYINIPLILEQRNRSILSTNHTCREGRACTLGQSSIISQGANNLESAAAFSVFC